MDRTTQVDEPTARAILSGERIMEMRQLARQIPVGSDVRQFAIDLVLATHSDQPSATEMVRQYVRFGSSPRGAQALILYAKVLAILDGRVNVAKEDLVHAAHAVLRHRMILSFQGQAEGISADHIIDDILRHLG
jgi:MoxR-like ATPase